MIKEYLRKTEAVYSQLPLSAQLGLALPLYILDKIYVAIGGRFNGKVRADAIQFMKEQAFFGGETTSDFPELGLWSKKDFLGRRPQKSNH